MGRPKGSKNRLVEHKLGELAKSTIYASNTVEDMEDDVEVSGDINICRIDSHNWAIVETYEIPEFNKKTKEPNKNAGELVQRTVGYYGNNLRLACLSALHKQPNGTHGAKEILKGLLLSEKRIIGAIGGING